MVDRWIKGSGMQIKRENWVERNNKSWSVFLTD